MKYVDEGSRINYHGHKILEGVYVIQQDSENYRSNTTLMRTDEDLLEGEWQRNRAGTLYISGTWRLSSLHNATRPCDVFRRAYPTCFWHDS